jgi:hypothetical protein
MSNETRTGSFKTDKRDEKDGGARATLIVKLKYKPILKVFLPPTFVIFCWIILIDYIA